MVAVPSAKWTQNLEKVPLTMQAFWPARKVPTRALKTLKGGSMHDLKSEDAERLAAAFARYGRSPVISQRMQRAVAEMHR